ncbi:hypothetical protein [Agarivorans litoreus]|uniref:hypothetical protein n=1 Tax=Agarivorans litoreus TaxID=1510455 RepID=UPI001C7DA22B|nr:hypothetical protein [Agarivorans litoreus]
MSYTLLALVADLYTPLLIIALFGMGWQQFKTNQKHQQLKQVVVSLLLSILTSYSLMIADNYWQWWPAFGLDYSTHTAVAFSLQLAIHRVASKFRWFTWLAYLSYLVLMWALNYHSVMDMLTTMLSVGLLLQLGAVCKNARVSNH